MKATNISERIRQIKDQIGRASLETAFDNLEDLIRSIDGMEIENEEEREFINQLISIKARYNNFNDTVITGIGAQQTELNNITNSLLSLTDSVHELLANNPDIIIPVKAEEITADLSIPTETVVTSQPIPPSSGEDKNGCLFSYNKSADQTNVKVRANWLRIFGGLALFILALALGFKLISGLHVDNSISLNEIKNSEPIKPNPTPPPTAVKLTITLPINSSQDIKKLAEILNKDQKNGREQVVFSNIVFEKNSINLNEKAKTELDHIAMILKQVPNQDIILSSTIGPEEEGSYKGNKELTLDDFRARQMFDYLKSKEVPITQMEFEGGGFSDPPRSLIGF